MSVADDNKLRSQLIGAYEALTPLEQAVMQLLSVIYETTTKTSLAECLRRCNIALFKVKGFPQPGLGPLLDKLASKKLVSKANNRLGCHPLLSEEMTRRAVQAERFEDMAKTVQEAIKISGWNTDYPYFYTYHQALRELRIAFYRGNIERVRLILNLCIKQFPNDFYQQSPWLRIFDNPFSADRLRALPDELLGDALAVIFTSAVRAFEPEHEVLALAEALLAENRCVEILRYYLTEHYLLRGEPAQARQYLSPNDSDYSRALRGWLAFLNGMDEEAIQHYEAALKLLQQRTRKRKVFFNHMAGIFFILALLARNTNAHLRRAVELIALLGKGESYSYTATYQSLLQVVLFQMGRIKQLGPLNTANLNSLVDCFFMLLAFFWVNADDPDLLSELVETQLEIAQKTGYHWFAMELTRLLQRLNHWQDAKPATLDRQAGDDGRSIVELFQRKEPWEHTLNALLEVSRAGPVSPAATMPARLVWWLHWVKSGGCTISPREQKRDAKGLWTRGRPVALKRLYTHTDRLDFLTPQDIEICACIRKNYEGYYGEASYELDERKALPRMVGHPLLFWEDAPEVRVELVKGEPELLITPQGSHWRLELSPKTQPDESLQVVKETPTRLKVIVFSEAHQQVRTILGEGLLVPGVAKTRVLETVAALSKLVTVQSSIDAGVESLEEVAADPQPHIHLLPFGQGLKIELLVKPFAGGGPYYRPGVGGERVIAEIDGKRVQARRELKLERQRAVRAITAVPTLSRQEATQGEWLLADPEECLEALLELQALGDRAVVAWPEGEALKVSRPVSLNQLRLTIKQQRDWFALSGELRLDDNQVLDMHRLLELIEQATGRFVPLGEGRFLALTREFRKRLEEMRDVGELTAKGMRFHPLAALVLEGCTAEAGVVRGDAAWKAYIQRLREAEALQPVIPSTLQAELRDYQVEGFQWLVRLAHWGVGACLADDMGLGKTVQALALILNRAQEGPTLVVAPTSVCLNWLDEARRFAPTLNASVFGGGDREHVLAQLGPYDLLVCSYGLLQQEVERLAQRRWRTIVLDEAQAIKNVATKRSQAAMNLQGDFKMITTGTPIENHLGELWNLFRFINPGLLGSLESFNRRFALPIERDQDSQARHRLKQLIQPFIRRRLKAEVLETLPPRTEILWRVELGAEEMALYEALRQQALARLAGLNDAEGQKPLQILAEIMRLRRACCHPSLVLPDTSLSGAKLAVFEEILEELLENRHKALVFSQFVDHLAILRTALDRKRIAYQYLDGSTPALERKQRVDAFQAGNGDVFLISLKAGGLGLNLTAADYVIHMDPWWNPAVEDQAADRAHRIGQQRPVTIYRLVTQGTIEEKIVALHHQKRDLADSLLEGTNMSGRISAEELLQLLQQA
ncbi:MAG: DEAD/DEAH box helicase [Candidatus Competibacteraceae bacterium]